MRRWVREGEHLIWSVALVFAGVWLALVWAAFVTIHEIIG